MPSVPDDTYAINIERITLSSSRDSVASFEFRSFLV